MKKLFIMAVIVLSLICIFTSCDMLPLPQEKEDVITIEDGYLVVNGVKTEYKVDDSEDTEIKEDVITIDTDGYLVVNGIKTEYKVHIKDEITVNADGYVIVNGVKTQYKIHTTDEIYVNADGYVVINGVVTSIVADKADVITVDEDGYLVVNGVKTEYEVKNKNHSFSNWILYNESETNCEKKLYYRTCSDCGTIEWRDGRYEDHSFTITTIYPTCQAGGYDTKTCITCGKVETCNYTPVANHTYPTDYITDNAYHWKKCINCDNITEKNEHTLDIDGACTYCGAPISETPGIIYDFSADESYAIVIGYEGSATKVKIASEYNGLPVKSIYKSAFTNNNRIISIIIPDSVVTIEDGWVETSAYGAFSGCSSLAEIIIPDSVTNIGRAAFYNCSSLTNITIPNSVNSIGDYAFYNCTSLVSITIYDSVTSIGNYTFSNCSSLTSIAIPDSVTSIGNYTFSNCLSLTSIAIPDSVTSIGDCAFSGCSNLTSIVIPDSVTSISNYAFSGCSNLTSIVIPDSVTSIGNRAFSNCSSLTSISIPDSVTSIGSLVFSGCAKLQFNEYKNGKYLGNDNNPYFALIEVSNQNLSKYTIHEDTKIIAGKAFSNCSRLESITIPDNVVTIGDSAFSYCDSLTNVVIPNSVISIEGCAFGWSYSITDVYYTGTEEQWNNINISASYNDCLFRATIHYSYVPEE